MLVTCIDGTYDMVPKAVKALTSISSVISGARSPMNTWKWLEISSLALLPGRAQFTLMPYWISMGWWILVYDDFDSVTRDYLRGWRFYDRSCLEWLVQQRDGPSIRRTRSSHQPIVEPHIRRVRCEWIGVMKNNTCPGKKKKKKKDLHRDRVSWPLRA